MPDTQLEPETIDESTTEQLISFPLIAVLLLVDTWTILLKSEYHISAGTTISGVELATIVGTATNPGHSFDGTHGGLIDGDDLDGIVNGGCTSQVRWPNFDCNVQ